MGKTSTLNNLKRNDKNRKFPKLGQKLTNEQQQELDVLIGSKSALPADVVSNLSSV